MDEALCPACGAAVSEIDLHCPRCGAPTAGGTAGTAGGGFGELAPGEVVSHFRIVGRLGSGGMGAVYRAMDLDLGREVALKFLHPEPTPGAKEGDLRFSREARAVAALDHPNIATLYEIGEHRGRRFLALALYEGETLCQRLERGPLAAGEAGLLGAQIAAALAAAHTAGIVHRDLKPDNLLLLPNGRLKLLDFGLARSREATPLTQPGMAPGTLAYMAPEVLRGEPAGPAADVWALGLVLCEALAGRHPLRAAAEASSWLEAVLLADPAPLPVAVPEALREIVARCLDKDPGRRFRDGGEAAQTLAVAGYLAEVSLPAQPVARPRRFRQAAVLALLLGLAGTAALAWWILRPAPPLAVAALPPEVASAGDPEGAGAIRLNLQIAVLRALVGLDGVSALDPEALRGIPEEPRAAARALAADQVVTASAQCRSDLCQVVLRRLDGITGAVLWTEGLSLPPSRPQLFAEAVTAAVRRGFGERRGPGHAAPAVEEADYREYLSIRQRLNARLLTPQAGLAELSALRRRAPELLEAAVLEGSLCRNLFESSGDAGYLERGLEGMRQAVRRAPDNPRPLSILFDLALTGGRLDAAAAALRQIEALDPGGAGLPLRQAQLAERQGRLEEAARLLAQATTRRPTWQVLLAAANLEYRLGHLEAARRDLATLLARSPGHVEGTATLAQIELLDGDPARALALLTELHARAPSPEVAGNLGIARMLLGRYAEAEVTFRSLLAARPGDPQVALSLADALALQGRTDEAQRFYRQVAETAAGDPPSWPVLSVRAQAQAHLGERQAAVASLERALRMTPDNAQLALEAALVFTLLGDKSSALFHAERALAGGVSPRWLGFPWFAELRAEPALAGRLARPKGSKEKL